MCVIICNKSHFFKKNTQLKLVRVVSEGHTKPSHCFAKNGRQKIRQTANSCVMKDEVANKMIPTARVIPVSSDMYTCGQP